MFQCKECSAQYKSKPDFCDCGNDTFFEIKEEVNVLAKKADTEIEPKSGIEQRTKDKLEGRKSFSEQYPQISRFIESIDIISGIIFGLCIILSILSIMLIGSGEDTSGDDIMGEDIKAEIKAEKIANIPQIESIWDSTAPNKEVSETVLPVQLAVQPGEGQIQVQPRPGIASQTVKKLTPKVGTKSKSSPVTKANKKSVAKPVTKVVPKPATKTTPPATSKPRATSPKATTTLTKQKSTPTVTKAQSDFNKQQVMNYKYSLRNALFSRLNVFSIKGNGTAILEFAVDSNGKLINRKFAQKSAEKSLNDAMYNMLMALPTYSLPPVGYKGETIKVIFTYTNGDYTMDVR